MASEGFGAAGAVLIGAELDNAAFRAFRYASCNCIACRKSNLPSMILNF